MYSKGKLFKLWLVQGITASRLVAGFLFITYAFTPSLLTFWQIPWVDWLLVWAFASDLIDGQLAKRWQLTSIGGATLDLLGDKYLTMICCCYFIVLDMAVVACAFIILKEVLLFAFRGIKVQGEKLFSTNSKFNRFIGGLTVFPLWGATLLYHINQNSGLWGGPGPFWAAFLVWCSGLLALVNMGIKFYKDGGRFLRAFTSTENKE